MLTNVQIMKLAKRMRINNLEGVFFKSQLEDMKLKKNKSYIINLEDEYDEEGERNDGSHYTCFQYNQNDKEEPEIVYFDSFGVAPPEEVLKFCNVKGIPYNMIDIQSLMNSACGWYCLAFLHFINVWDGRSKCLYYDCYQFTNLFEDLGKTSDWKKNELILKQFFKSPNDKQCDTLENVGFTFVPENTNIASGIANVNTI